MNDRPVLDRKYKKELTDYGYEVVKISMKEQKVLLRKIG